MNTDFTPRSRLVADSNALFKQFSLSIRRAESYSGLPLNTLADELRHCLYLIRSSSSISADESLLLSTQAHAYNSQLSNLMASGRADEDERSVLHVIRDFCDLIQQELGTPTHPLPGRCSAKAD